MRHWVRRRWALWRLAVAKRRLPYYTLPMLDAWNADVMLCSEHEWVAEDRHPYGIAPGTKWYICCVCRRCRAQRCGYLIDPNPCLEPRHHVLAPHRYADGTTQKVGA